MRQQLKRLLGHSYRVRQHQAKRRLAVGLLNRSTATLDVHRPIAMAGTEYRQGAPAGAIFDLFAACDYVPKLLIEARIKDAEPVRRKSLQRDVGAGEVAKSAKHRPFVNNAWLIPGERLFSLVRLGRRYGCAA